MWITSPDFEIQSWPETRRRQIQLESSFSSCDLRDHIEALDGLLGACRPLNASHILPFRPQIPTAELDIHQVIVDYDLGAHKTGQLMLPVGNQDAPLGLMFDSCSVKRTLT